MVVACSSGFVFFVCTGLVLQDLRDEGGVGFGSDEDGGHLQWW